MGRVFSSFMLRIPVSRTLDAKTVSSIMQGLLRYIFLAQYARNEFAYYTLYMLKSRYEVAYLYVTRQTRSLMSLEGHIAIIIDPLLDQRQEDFPILRELARHRVLSFGALLRPM